MCNDDLVMIRLDTKIHCLFSPPESSDYSHNKNKMHLNTAGFCYISTTKANLGLTNTVYIECLKLWTLYWV